MNSFIKIVDQSKRLIGKAIWKFRNKHSAKKVERKIASSLSYIESIKEIFKGQRGFVIGNGPSLQMSDLDLLVDEVTIASNKIYLAFDKTEWRPNFYTIVDRLVWEKIAETVPRLGLKPIVPSYLTVKETDYWTVRSIGNAADEYLANKSISFSVDLCEGYFGGYSVTFENLQLAAHLGLDPIYIIGCDHFYDKEEGVKAEHAISNKSTKNHFCEQYRSVGEVVNPAPTKLMTIAYEVAAKFAKNSGRQIINATRGGHLEAFQRCEFDSLFQ